MPSLSSSTRPRVDVETEDAKARVAGGERKRQADVAEADDADQRLLLAETGQ